MDMKKMHMEKELWPKFPWPDPGDPVPPWIMRLLDEKQIRIIAQRALDLQIQRMTEAQKTLEMVNGMLG
jgi:hypothetical protein